MFLPGGRRLPPFLSPLYKPPHSTRKIESSSPRNTQQQPPPLASLHGRINPFLLAHPGSSFHPARLQGVVAPPALSYCNPLSSSGASIPIGGIPAQATTIRVLRQPHGITVTLVRSLAGSFLGAPTDRGGRCRLRTKRGRDLVHKEVSCLPPSSLLIPFTGEQEGKNN